MLTDEQIKTKAREIHRETQYFEANVTASLIKIATWARDSGTVPTPSDEEIILCRKEDCQFDSECKAEMEGRICKGKPKRKVRYQQKIGDGKWVDISESSYKFWSQGNPNYRMTNDDNPMDHPRR